MNRNHFSSDIQEFLFLLTKYKVRYTIVGGEAVIFYGHARLTGDVDFLYDMSKDNTENLFQALLEFWDGSIPDVEAENELQQQGLIIQFGVPPNRIDLLNKIDGLSFQEVWDNKTEVYFKVGGNKIPVYYIGLDQLIKNKELLKRFKDMEDLKYLKEVKSKKK
jgi:hypothetical protein